MKPCKTNESLQKSLNGKSRPTSQSPRTPIIDLKRYALLLLLLTLATIAMLHLAYQIAPVHGFPGK